MIKIKLNFINLEKICISGQCFRMNQTGENRFALVAKDRYLELWQDGNETVLECSREEYDLIWKDYFDIDRDYESIVALTDKKDKYLSDALQSGYGIRILNQDLWEMLVSFIISQQNNITRIRRSIENISVRFGDKKTAVDKTTFYAFPTPKQLAAASEEELRECNLGYRAPYVLGAAKGVCDGTIDLETIKEMDYDSARNELLKIFGVGPKVADCICLFALGHTQAFPKDTHINQALSKQYPQGFPFERYSPYQGIFQQFIFYKELHG